MLGLPGNRVLPENYDKAEKTEKYLKTKSLFKELQFFCSEEKKRTTFMHVRDRVVDSTCWNRYLLEFTARTLRRFVFKILRTGSKTKSSIGQHFWDISTLQSNIDCLNGIALTAPVWKIYHACSFLQICLDKLKGTFTYFLTIYIKIMFPFVVTFSTSKLFFPSFLVLIICDINDCKNTMEIYLS